MAIGDNRPFGLKPVKGPNGAPWNGQATLYFIPEADASAYQIGSIVTLAGSADTNGVPSVSIGVAGATCVGAIVGVHPVNPMVSSRVGNPLSLERKNIPATKTQDYYVMVVDSPDVEFHIQEAFTGTAMVAANVGLNANFSVAQPSQPNFQLSATVLDNTTQATTATLNLKILGLVQQEGNEYGLGAIWRVKLNNHAFRAGVAGV